MKQLLKFSLVLIIAVMFQQCTEQEALRPEKVQFAFHLESSEITGGRISTLPDGSVLKISIQTLAGNPVLTNQTVNLLSFGERFVTDPLELTPGTYKIVDFLIVHGTTVLYAVPRIGSPLANIVVHPLDFEFTVTKNNISTIDMEVIKVTGHLPEDFGYTSFNVGIINTFELSVFTEANNQVNFASAEGYILQNSDTIQTFTISPTVNRIAFLGDDTKTYTVDVIKDGYGRYTREFIPSTLSSDLGNKPLKVVLSPAVTIRAYADPALTNRFRFNLIQSFTGGDITINWGDGRTGAYPLNHQEKAHFYDTAGVYFISITGDLSKIELFECSGAYSQTKKINVEHLPELKEIRTSLTSGPGIVDLSHNTKLHSIELVGTSLKTLSLPADHAIRYIMISGPNLLTTDAVDSIIDNIYTNVVNKNTKNGFFGLKQISHDTNNTMLIGPPSAEGLAKLLMLRYTYEWVLYPNP